MQEYSNNSDESFEKNVNLREQIEHYLLNWKWFLASTLIAMIIAFTFLRYAVPMYNATAMVLVKDERKGGLASELSAFSDLGMLKNVKSSVDNEIEVIKSRTLIAKTIKELGLNVSYVNLGRIKDGEIYKDSPVTFFFTNQSEKFYKETQVLTVTSTSKATFDLFNSKGALIGNFKYGSEIPFLEGQCTVFKNKLEADKVKENYSIRVEVYPVIKVAESYKSRLQAMTLSKYTSIVEMSIVDPVLYRAEDFLNALIQNYNEDAIEDKNFIAENTSKFIEQRLRIITDELEGVEKDAEVFKKSNKVTDITSEAGLFLENASQFQKSEIETETQLKVVSTMMDYLSKSSNENLIPANILTSDVNAVGLIEQYNLLVLERNRLLKSAGPENAMVLNVDKKISSLKENVKSSLNQLKTSLQIKRNDLSRQNAIVEGRISQIPTQEKEFRIIARQQQVKEALYLYLLEKREETAISLAVTEPNAKVIDAAHSSGNPVFPNRTLTFIVAMFAGLFLPFAVLYIVSILDTKIKSRNDIVKATTIPFIGDIPNNKSEEKVVTMNSRTNIAEAIRIVRTNLEFLLTNNVQGKAKTIFLTSTFPKEGKTFVSVNLASTIALSGKKVLLIGMDIRNPKFDEYINVPNVGVTNYLASNDGSTIESYFIKMENFESFYVLPAGIIPPNPAELLMDKKVDEMFADLKDKFDYIIVDTAPVSLVTDTLIIAKNADTFVYVARANFLDKRMLELPEKLYREKKLPNMSILLNDSVTRKQYGYGYGYGYGYEAESENKKSWKNIFKK